MGIICSALYLFVLLILARVVLSYFPLSPGSPMSSVYSALYGVTEPVMGPLRRIIPPLGMFDLSPIVVIIGIQLLQGALC